MANASPRTPRELWADLRGIAGRAGDVWRMVPPRHKASLGIAAAVMTLAGFSGTAIPLLLGLLIDAVRTSLDAGKSPEGIFGVAAWFLGGIAAMIFVREALNVFRRFLVERTCTRIEKDVSVTLISHLLQIDLASLTHDKLGALQGRIFRSVTGFMRFLRLSFLDFIPALMTGGFALAATVSKEPRLGLVMVGVIPVSIAITLWQLLSQTGIRMKLIRSHEEMEGTVAEQLGGLDYIRVSNTHIHEMRRVSQAAENRRATELRHHVVMSLFGSSKALTEGVFHVAVLSLAVYLAVRGEISVGDIFTFSILFLNVMTPLSEVHRIIDEGHHNSICVADLLDLLARPKDASYSLPPTGEPKVREYPVAITIDDLDAEYAGRDGQPARKALRGISLDIRSGETIGVAGRSGCGKSTWMKVLLRLVHPTGGAVKVNGVPLAQLSRDTISRLFGYVGQAPFLFSGSVAENIRYGCPADCTDEDVRRAAQQAGIHDEILDMPAGYDSRVAERGQNLSGGQRQRIAIARVFLKNPPILILDEATSALDTVSERVVQRAIDAARADRTVIQVAHRLSTIADSDRIVVFDDGQIAEVGTYEELVDQDGVFADLVRHAEGDAAPAAKPARGRRRAVARVGQ